MLRTTFLLERSVQGKWCTLRIKHPDGTVASVGCCAKSSYLTLRAAVSSIKASDLDDPPALRAVLRAVGGDVLVTSARIRKRGEPGDLFITMSTAAWMLQICLPKLLKKWRIVLKSPSTGAKRILPNRDATLIIDDTSACAVALARANITVCTPAVYVSRRSEMHQITMRTVDHFPPGFPTLAQLDAVGGVELISTSSSSNVKSVVGGGLAAIYLTLGGCAACQKGNVYGDYNVCFVDVESESKIVTVTNQTVSIVKIKKRKRNTVG
jgi:hypothetical protein